MTDGERHSLAVLVSAAIERGDDTGAVRLLVAAGVDVRAAVRGMASTGAERSRRYRERKAAAVANAVARDTES